MDAAGKKGSGKQEFDPFAAGPGAYRSSKSWLWATGLQALFTAGLLALARYAQGRSWEHHAEIIMLIGIVATWSLALRTIRARLVELLRHWQQYSQGLIRRASESGRHLIAAPLSTAQERYIKGTIWRLRIIAAGLTIPFFVMPMVCSLVAVFFSIKCAPSGPRDTWVIVASATLLGAVIVAGYFHWAILAAPVPVRIAAQTRRYLPQRTRRR